MRRGHSESFYGTIRFITSNLLELGFQRFEDVRALLAAPSAEMLIADVHVTMTIEGAASSAPTEATGISPLFSH